MIHRNCILMSLVMGMAILSGCRSAPIASKPDVVSEYPKVTLSSKSLSKAVALNPAVVTRSATGNLQVSQPIRSMSKGGIDIQYRFIWLDEMGRSIQPEMTWRYKRLEPQVPETISASSTSDSAVDYQVQLRWSRP